jgi:GNAT superfamily N-acetyltransferase
MTPSKGAMIIAHLGSRELAAKRNILSKLTFNDNTSSMLIELNDIRCSHRALVAMHGSTTVGWAMLRIGRYFDTRRLFVRVYTFVKPAFRRKGIGKALYSRAQKLYGHRDIVVFRHDDMSRLFYDNIGAPPIKRVT